MGKIEFFYLAPSNEVPISEFIIKKNSCLLARLRASDFRLRIMDPEIQKSMGQMRMFRQQQGNCAAKIQALKQTRKRVELTNKEISSLAPETALYASVGHCFIFKSRKDIDEGMAVQQKNIAEQIEKTEEQKNILEKKEKETKETIEELMKNKQVAN